MKPKLRNVLRRINEYFQIALGVLLASLGLKGFLLPNHFLDGGVTGMALLGHTIFDINPSLLLIILSVPFLLLGFFLLSRAMVIKSIFSILALAFVIQIESFPAFTDEKLLVAIFGGLLVGAGIGLTMRNGAVLDGSEILGLYVNERIGISVGKIILAFNVALFSLTALTVSLEVALYSILTYAIAAKVTDFVIEGFEDFIGVMIVSKQHEELQENLVNGLGVGLTTFRSGVGYGRNGATYGVDVLQTVVNRIDIRKLQRLVEQAGPEAFIVEYKVNQVRGGVLRNYLHQRKPYLQVQQPEVPPLRAVRSFYSLF